MNNDFNYRPSQPKPEVTSPSQAEEPGITQPEEQAAAPASTVITSDRQGDGFKKFLKLLAVLLLVTAAASGAYFYQDAKIKSLQSSEANLQAQVTSLKTGKSFNKADNNNKHGDSATVSTPASVDQTDIITGIPTKVTTSEADVVAWYLLGKKNISEVWIESGTQPDALKPTAHQKTSAEGQAGMYQGNGIVLTGLKAKGTYYYRAAGIVDGKTVYGGITTFTAE